MLTSQVHDKELDYFLKTAVMTKKELNEIFNEMNNISISDLGEFINNLFEERFDGKFKKFEKFINAFHNTPILNDETYYVALDTIRDIESSNF